MIDLILSTIISIPKVPKIPSLYQDRSERPLISPLSGDNLFYGESYQITECRLRWLKLISWSEGTYSNDQIQYNIMFTGKRFSSYHDHPRQLNSTNGLSSDAAGAYQYLSTTWDSIAQELNFPSFLPHYQDQGALYLIDQAGVLNEIDNCKFNPTIIDKLSPIWAGLPTLNGTSYYNQSHKTYKELYNFWINHAN